MDRDTTNTHAVFVMFGASNHSNSERENDDYYATDPRALELLLELESFAQDVWEPACGGGHLSRVLEAHGFHVRSTDLIDRGYGESGIDFLQTEASFDGDIITNPPYKYAREFVEHGIQCVSDGHKVAMFLRLNFLEGKARRQLFENYPPRGVRCYGQNQLLQERQFQQRAEEQQQCSSLCVVHLGERIRR